MANALTDELNRLANTSATPAYTPTDWSSYYNEQYNAQLLALQAAYDAQKQQLEAQLPQIKQSYDTQRNQTYTNSRRAALGNNEALASQGLAGNAYAGPVSGYSETSRVSDSNALRNALNAAGLQQRNTEEGVQNSISQAGFSKDQAAAEALANINAAKATAIQGENQYAADYALQQAAQEEAIRQYNEQLALAKQQNALSQAYQELSSFGRIVTQTAADALGVTIGTTLSKIQGKSSGSSGSRKSSLTDEEIYMEYLRQYGKTASGAGLSSALYALSK